MDFIRRRLNIFKRPEQYIPVRDHDFTSTRNAFDSNRQRDDDRESQENTGDHPGAYDLSATGSEEDADRRLERSLDTRPSRSTIENASNGRCLRSTNASTDTLGGETADNDWERLGARPKTSSQTPTRQSVESVEICEEPDAQLRYGIEATSPPLSNDLDAQQKCEAWTTRDVFQRQVQARTSIRSAKSVPNLRLPERALVEIETELQNDETYGRCIREEVTESAAAHGTARDDNNAASPQQMDGNAQARADDVFELGRRQSQGQVTIISPGHSASIVFAGSDRTRDKSISLTANTNEDLGDIVADRTLVVLKATRMIKSNREEYVFGVRTLLYHNANELLKKRGLSRVVILKGSGFGCDQVGKMLFAERCGKGSGATGYVLEYKHEWAVVNSNTAKEQNHCVVLILNADLENWVHILEHQMISQARPGGYLTVIITSKSTPEMSKFEDNIIDASDCKNGPSREDIANYFDHLAKIKKVRITPDSDDQYSLRTSEDHGRFYLMSQQTKQNILESIGRYEWVRKMNRFFTNQLQEGSKWWKRPTPEQVDALRTMKTDKRLHFTAMWAVFAHHGKLTNGRIKQLATLQSQGDSGVFFSMPNNLHRQGKAYKKTFEDDICPLIDYVRKNGLLDSFRRELRNLLDDLEGRYLKYEGESYGFTDDNVRSSLTYVLSEVDLVHVLHSADENFMFDYVNLIGTKCVQLYVPVNQWTKLEIRTFFERMKDLWMIGYIHRCIKHPIMVKVFYDFLRHVGKASSVQCSGKTYNKKMLSSTNEDAKWLVLMKTEQVSIDGKFPKKRVSCLYFAVGEPAVCRCILHDETWHKRRKKDKYATLIKEQENIALVAAAKLNQVDTIRVFINAGVALSKAALTCAISSMSLDTVGLFLQEATFDDDVWFNALLESLTTLSQNTYSTVARQIFDSILNSRKVNVSSSHGGRPLVHEAAIRNNLEMLEILFDDNHDIDINVDTLGTHSIDTYGDIATTALLIATDKDHHRIVRFLLSKGARQRVQGVDVNPVFIACKKGYIGILKDLVDANPGILVEVDNEGKLPIMWACQHGRLRAVEYLSGRLHSTLLQTDSLKRTPLHFAVQCEREHIVTFLVGLSGIDVTAKDADGHTPLMLAYIQRKNACAMVLLRHCMGKRIPQDNDLMKYVVERGDHKFLDILLNHRYNATDDELMVSAVTNEQISIVEMLLDHGARVNAEFQGRTPIGMASCRGNVTMLKLLYRRGADLGVVQASTGDTIVHLASREGHSQCIQEIMKLPEHEQLIDKKNKDRDTALHISASQGHAECIKILLQNGFQRAHLNRQDKTPVMLAVDAKDKCNKSQVKRFEQSIGILKNPCQFLS